MSDFTDLIEVIRQYFPQTSDKDYDGLIVKRLESSNTLDVDKSGHQSHIAITGSQMDMFPYLKADGYFNTSYADKDDSLKKYLVVKIPFHLYKDNIEELGGLSDNSFFYNSDGYCRSFVCVVRSRRKGQTDQIQLSLITQDDESFVSFRKLLHSQDYLVVLKHKQKLEYDCFGVRSGSDCAAALAKYNNAFLKENTSTTVKTSDLITIKNEEDAKGDYSLDELGQILKAMYNDAPKDMQVTAIHVFGIKFGEIILKNGYGIKDLTNSAGINESYTTELYKGIRLFKSFRDNAFGMSMWGKEGKYSEKPEGVRKTGAENILVYGVPGSGKSYYIQQNYCTDRKYMERVVFHPDYTYSDFVGQILPRVENGLLKYVFTPGPFTKIMEKAYWDPENNYYLIIEELNRGNAPAIFGEIFQLLDRKHADQYSEEEVGESEYGISNYDIANAVYHDESKEVRIPSNLYVLATMNTSDQNVFTLDTAFQRRWIMQLVKNDVENSRHVHSIIEGTGVMWGDFASVINNHILDANEGLGSAEDKRLGSYFVKERELQKDRFPGKVLKYLWDDAFKFSRDIIFRDEINSFECLVEHYESSSDDKLKSILRAEVYNEMLKSVVNSETSNVEEEG